MFEKIFHRSHQENYRTRPAGLRHVGFLEKALVRWQIELEVDLPKEMFKIF
jgi:hypothetical protein